MPLLDKKLYLAELEERLNAYVPANDVRRIVESAADALTAYDVKAARADGDENDDSKSLIKLFLDAKEVEGRSRQTIQQYSYVLNCLRQGVGAPLTKVTVHHLRSWLMREKERGVSLSTLEGYRYVMSSFFGWCWKEELLAKNPTVNLQPIRKIKTIRKPFSQVEIERMKEAAETTRDKTILAVLLSTGCRISEVCQLDVLDIDMQARAVTVLGKGAKQRRVYLDDVAVMYLKRYFRERTDDSPALFVGKGSSRLTPDGVRYALKQIEARSGVENVHPHRFRRTFATDLWKAGVPVETIRILMGHTNIATTLRYIDIDPCGVKQAFARAQKVMARGK